MGYQEAVKDFQKAMNLEWSDSPRLISLKQFSLRMELITEGLSKYSKAVSGGDIVKIAGSVGDLLYVVFGAAVEHGLPIDEIFSQIHDSNMTKVGGVIDSSGKLQKPSTFKPVDLRWVKRGMKDVFVHSKLAKR